MTSLRRICRLRYGDALAAEDRNAGVVPVVSSGGVTGTHDMANLGAPSIVVGRKGSHGSLHWLNGPAFVIDTAFGIDASMTTADLRWLYYVLRTLGLPELTNDVGVPGLSRESVYEQDIGFVPPLDEQRRIADFLDDQIARLDTALEQTASIADGVAARPVLALAERLLDCHGRWRLDAGRKLAPVGAYFTVDLGKMLNEERAGGSRLRPYLRNTNVQWDDIDTRDLKQMHFEPGERHRYGLVPGDLLICEGGQPGRAAIWEGPAEEIYYQKALHRARPRTGNVEPRWFLHLLRLCVAREMFIDASGTTIAHLTNERLRALGLPFPPVVEQRAIVAEIDGLLEATRAASQAALDLASLLQERKHALITACVTGTVDVSSASETSQREASMGVRTRLSMFAKEQDSSSGRLPQVGYQGKIQGALPPGYGKAT